MNGDREESWWDLVGLVTSGAAIVLACWVVGRQSWAFAPGLRAERPLISVLLWLGAAFAAYLWGLKCAVRVRGRVLLMVVVTVALMSRAVLLDGEPIQEVDFYRYVWDGNVTASGVSPYRFSPAEVRRTSTNGEDESLVTLRESVRRNAGLQTVLERVHFAELRTPYPPVSQAVFAVAAFVTPDDADVRLRTRVMRLFVLAFDLATVFTIVGLLRRVEMPLGWSVAYAWCPLVLKEFGNSLHLDSIAVFLTTAAVYALVRASGEESRSKRWLFASAALLALGVGAKLYPVLLTPVVGAFAIRRFGLRRTIAAIAVFVGIAIVVLFPMLHAKMTQPEQEGLTRFLLTWEINDFLFLLLIENLKTPEMLGDQPEAWFSIVPHAWRTALTGWVPMVDDMHRVYPAFAVARTVTLLIWLGIVARETHRVWTDPGPRSLLGSLFASLAWFWMLAPTQNPWYWCWALPFLPFTRHRCWILVGGFTLLYYLRFSFATHFADVAVAGTPYQGVVFFDLVVTWIEFAPILAFLAWESWHAHER